MQISTTLGTVFEVNRGLRIPRTRYTRTCSLVFPQAAQTHVTRCNVIYILTSGESERDL